MRTELDKLKSELYSANLAHKVATLRLEAAKEAVKEYKRMHRVEILDVDWGRNEAIVTWAWSYGENGGCPMTCVVGLDFQPEESDVGVNAGFNADGDCPDEVLELVAEQAYERKIEQWEDRYGV